MEDIYNYKENIKVITTTNGDKVITMNEEIYISILNHVFNSSEYLKERGFNASSVDTLNLWDALRVGKTTAKD